MCARRFLFVIFFVTLLVAAGGFALFQFGGSVLRKQALPTVPYEAPPPASGPDYVQVENWLNLPDTVPPGPAEWTPKGLTEDAERARSVAVFYIHPTTYLQRDRWNALIGHRESQDRAALFVRSQASAFNAVGRIYAPRYRQAAFGAFLDTGENATKALDLAYSDVARAFDRFLAQEPDAPIVLAGHSQGGLHLTRLLHERIARNPALQRRIVAAYIGGWPVSTVTDVPAMGLPACLRPDQARCLLSWQSFSEPANTDLITGVFEGSTGFNGQKRRREGMLCVNPVTGSSEPSTPAQSLGTLIPVDTALSDADLVPGAVGARCEGGFLLISGADDKLPELGPYVLPGNNYHVYDYALFWGDIRRDFARRLAAFRSAQ
ncbi:DUF3089 domain-containing protein [Sphingomonas glaciei]|uniref:DUF3089 domain-containing protein n=1 Tax=Sphingomonas glaciei TaxID=2938948 RepID=A0ABY5MZF8_9SPHN|nr:DUF3089 domain-containing protein [Sphingomonas glaciei]UUR08854.1 DUF3089 domain-containing protein [Sphingomonas glaciei]